MLISTLVDREAVVTVSFSLTVYVNFYSRRSQMNIFTISVWQYMLISTLVDKPQKGGENNVWQYMLISTLVDGAFKLQGFQVWQYMLISTLVDQDRLVLAATSDSIC